MDAADLVCTLITLESMLATGGLGNPTPIVFCFGVRAGRRCVFGPYGHGGPPSP